MTPALCREMCDSAEAILARSPWERMDETEVFTLQPVSGGEIYFVSVMGGAGEHAAIAYYPGRESFAKFCAVQGEQLSPRDSMETILLNGHLQAGFEPRAGLQPSEKALLKAAGRRYRGLWPVFRSHRSARIPWPVDKNEAAVLSRLMALTVGVLDRVGAGETLTSNYDAKEFFLRRADGTDGVCRPSKLPLPLHRLQAALDEHALDGLRRVRMDVEMELVLMLSPVADVPRGEPPYFPFVVLLAGQDSGLVLGVELLSTKDGLDAALVRLPETIVNLIKQAGAVPSSIAVRHPILLSALEAYGNLLGIKIKPQPFLPAAEEALNSLRGLLGGMP